MSEVNDAVQILIVAGKLICLFTDVSVRIAVLTAKTLNTIYLSKWNGSVSFARLRRIKGDNIQFVNVSTEDMVVLKQIEQEMQAHGILFARMPDLCGGDGRTQYVISSDDMVKFKAFLLDHSAGRYRGIKVGLISAADYARSGLTRNETPTQEMKLLTGRAEQERPARLPSPGEEPRQLPETVRSLKRRELGNNAIYISQPPLKAHGKWEMYQLPDGMRAVIIPKSDIWRENGRDTARAAVRPDGQYITVHLGSGECRSVSGREIGREFRSARREEAFLPELSEKLQERDLKNSVSYLMGPPVKAHERWEMYQMPNSREAVVIPRKDVIKGYADMEHSLLYPRMALIRDQGSYIVIDQDTGRQRVAGGGEIRGDLDAAGSRAETLDEARRQDGRAARTETEAGKTPPLPRSENAQGESQDRAGYTRVTIHEKMFHGEDEHTYVTRVPYTQGYVRIPKEDSFLSGNKKMLTADLYPERSYVIENRDGIRTGEVAGRELRMHYEDKTRGKVKKTGGRSPGRKR